MGFGLTLHPDMAGSGKHPDFLAQRPGEPGFYLEATLAAPDQTRPRAIASIASLVVFLDSATSVMKVS